MGGSTSWGTFLEGCKLPPNPVLTKLREKVEDSQLHNFASLASLAHGGPKTINHKPIHENEKLVRPHEPQQIAIFLTGVHP